MRSSNEAKALDRSQVNSAIAVSSLPSPHRYYHSAKRATDILGAIFGIIISLPVVLLIMLLIKLDDPKAPVIFTQIRIGKHGKPFKIYKFRSMVQHAESMLGELLDKNEVSGAMFKMKNDPRVTRIGKILRKTSLDELPQLWNVLKGDMSLVET